MIIVFLLFLLLSSFTVHLLGLVLFVVTKRKKFFNIFIGTSLSNIMIGVSLSIVALLKPELIRAVNLGMILFGISGFVTILILTLKIFIFRNIYRRTKDPKFYHHNFFGKKVYEKGIVKQYEFFALIISIPFFLLIGAYFVTLLINFIRFGRI